jgi:outer membrane immunogenic protein
MGSTMRPLLRAIAFASLLLGTAVAAAQAADLPAPGPAPAYKAPVYGPPPFLWTGFYVGGNLGAGWNQATVNDLAPPIGAGLNFGNPNSNGFFVGGSQVGANYQIEAFVIGAEATFDWAANHNNTGPGMATGIGTVRVSANDRWITTVAARFGVAIDHWLIYAKAGGGWVGAGNFTVTNLSTGGAVAISGNNTNSGWLIGTGVEYALTPNWSAKLEFDYLGLHNQSYAVPATSPIFPGDVFNSTGRAFMMVTGGVNYLFNFGG